MNTRFAFTALATIIVAACFFFLWPAQPAKTGDALSQNRDAQPPAPPASVPIESKIGPAVLPADKPPEAGAGPRSSGLDGIAALNSPSMREFTTRAIVRDYANFVGGLSLSTAGKDLIYQLLVDQNLSATDEEATEYNKLITEAIGADAYARLQSYREGLRRDSLAEGALRYVEKSQGGLGDDMTRSARAAIVATNISKADIDALFEGNAPSDQSIEQARQRVASAMDQAFQANAPGLTVEQRKALKQWYIKTTIDQRAAYLKSKAKSASK